MQHGRWTHESRNGGERVRVREEGWRFERKDGEEEEEEEAPVQDLATTASAKRATKRSGSSPMIPPRRFLLVGEL